MGSAAAVLGTLAPEAAADRAERVNRADRAALPLPVPPAESLVTEGVTVEGPLVNNITLPMTK
ncbi:hypothetical protein FNH04_45320 [Streptomyces phyllanthi]|uniref:Uncharacterized protein n=1 Tax=Streptomyces phyllanthi TaxID=1803180 RepID=A0A5N8WHC5_9ACTN|nr:hypothetical protein [Streptomyces phyllanthi]